MRVTCDPRSLTSWQLVLDAVPRRGALRPMEILRALCFDEPSPEAWASVCSVVTCIAYSHHAPLMRGLERGASAAAEVWCADDLGAWGASSWHQEALGVALDYAAEHLATWPAELRRAIVYRPPTPALLPPWWPLVTCLQCDEFFSVFHSFDPPRQVRCAPQWPMPGHGVFSDWLLFDFATLLTQDTMARIEVLKFKISLNHEQLAVFQRSDALTCLRRMRMPLHDASLQDVRALLLAPGLRHLTHLILQGRLTPRAPTPVSPGDRLFQAVQRLARASGLVRAPSPDTSALTHLTLLDHGLNVAQLRELLSACRFPRLEQINLGRCDGTLSREDQRALQALPHLAHVQAWLFEDSSALALAHPRY